MNTKQKNKVLQDVNDYFELKKELSLPPPQFETVLGLKGVGKELYAHYRQYGYTWREGKTLKCC